MITKRLDQSEQGRLAIIGASNLLRFREAGAVLKMTWGETQGRDMCLPDATVCVFEAEGIKDQPCNWQGWALMVKTGWRLSDETIDPETIKSEWIMGLDIPCPPWDSDFLLIQAEEAKPKTRASAKPESKAAQ